MWSYLKSTLFSNSLEWNTEVKRNLVWLHGEHNEHNLQDTGRRNSSSCKTSLCSYSILPVPVISVLQGNENSKVPVILFLIDALIESLTCRQFKVSLNPFLPFNYNLLYTVDAWALFDWHCCSVTRGSVISDALNILALYRSQEHTLLTTTASRLKLRAWGNKLKSWRFSFVLALAM